MKKDVKLPMEFIPGGSRFEPKLPLRKAGEKFKVKFNWFWIIILATLFIASMVLIILSF